MRITRLKLTNWGPHESLDIDLDTPVFGLLGPNASGKSNIMSAIAFGFTGLLELNQATYVRTVAGEEINNGSVDLYFIKGGIKGRIFRQVGKSPSRKLWWEDWSKPITKAAEIDRLMSDILDCDKKAIDQAVFLSQGHLADFLMGLPAAREADFARMCQVDHLGLISDIAAQQMVELQKRVVDLTSQRDEATLALEQADAALRTSEGELELLPDRQPLINWMTDRLNRLRDVRRRESAVQTALADLQTAQEHGQAVVRPPGLREAYDQHLEELTADLARCRTAADQAAGLGRELTTRRANAARLTAAQIELAAVLSQTGRLMTVQRRLVEVQTEREAIRLYSTYLEQRQRWQGQVEGIRSMIATSEAELSQYPPDAEREEQLAEVRRRQNELAPLRLKLQLAATVGSHLGGCCPLCDGQDLSHLPTGDQLLAQQVDLIEAERRWNAMEVEIDQARRNRQNCLSRLEAFRSQLQTALAAEPAAVREVQTSLDPELQLEQRQLTDEQLRLQSQMAIIPRLNQEIEQLKNALDAVEGEPQLTARIADLDKLAVGREELERQVNVGRQYVTVRRAADRRTADAQTLFDSAMTSSQEAVEHYNGLWRARPKALNIAETAVEAELQTALDELAGRQAERERAQGMIRANTDALRRAEGRIQELAERAKENAARQSVIGHLEELKNAFGRSGIPRHYLSKVFDSLVGLTQENLADWDTDFQVEKDEANLFNFLFCRTDDPETLLDQSQLSGGQRTRLALSFVQAVQRLLYPGLDFLCVDEPSNHLDAEGVEGLVRLFQTIASQNEAGEAQVIVVDHNPLLNRAFSKAVTLERKN